MILLNDENFEKEVQGAGKPVLVDFFAVWCEPCSMLGPILERVADDMKEKVVLLKANIDNMPKTAQKFGVERIPTVVLFKEGKPASGFVGVLQAPQIKEWLAGFLEDNTQKKMDEMIERYENYATANGFRLNPDRKVVERVVTGIFENEKKHGKKYCPCRRVTGNAEEDANKICPCAFHKEEIKKDGHCFCNLFVE